MPRVDTIKSRVAKFLKAIDQPLRKHEWVGTETLELWSQVYKVKNAPILALEADEATLNMSAIPTVAHRLAAVANACNSFDPPVRMRVIGHHDESWGPERQGERDERDRLHNWSPINLDRDAVIKRKTGKLESPILYISFQHISHKFLNQGSELLSFKELTSPRKMALVRAYCGDSMASLARRASERGYTPPILPAPDVLSLGGVLAVGGHGSRMSDSIAEQDDSGKARLWPGSISASVDRMTVVRWSQTDGEYVAASLRRSSRHLPFAAANLGRVIVVDATLRCLPDYCLGLEFQKKLTKHVFGSNADHKDSLASLAKEGGYEVLAFRPSPKTKTKDRVAHVVQWTHSHAKPKAIGWLRQHGLDDLFKSKGMGRNVAGLVSWPVIMKNARKVADDLAHKIAVGKIRDRDKKIDRYVRTAGDQRMYAHSDVTPVEASGWAIIIPKVELQTCGKFVYDQAMASLEATKDRMTKAKERFSHRQLAFECRSANLDDLGNSSSARIPNLSMAAPYRDPLTSKVNGSKTHMVLWVSILYLTTEHTIATVGPYLEHFETALQTKADTSRWILRPEWAKGWGYRHEGAWRADAPTLRAWFEKGWPGSASVAGSWKQACKLAHELDPNGVFSSPFHDTILPKP